ncbi:MAG: winged helix-turn-helix domain-containing protein [Pseudomonadota bacterium]
MDLFDGFQLGDYQVTPVDGRVSRDGALVTTLSPRLVELLLVLAKSSGQVVSRDSLMSEIWPNTVVSEVTLTHYLSELRKAFGDSSRDQRVIETLPKRGYRLRVDVRPIGSGEAASPRRRPWALAAAVALVGVALVFGYTSRATPSRANLVIAPITVASTADSALATVAERYTLVLADRLRALQGLYVSQAEPTADLNSLAAADRNTYVLFGELTEDNVLGERLTLRMFLSHANRFGTPVSTPLGQYEIASADPDYFVELPSVRDSIVTAIKAPLAKLIRADLGEVRSTADPEAYRLYLLAHELQIHDAACGESGRALVERALEIDPNFADGWSLLGYTHWTAMWSCGGGVVSADLAIAAADRALALDPDYQSAYYLKTNVLSQIGRYAEAYAFASEALANNPDSAFLNATVSVALRYGGMVDEAMQSAQRAIELDPQFYISGIYEAPLAMLYAGRVNAFVEHMPDIDDSLADFYAAFAFMATGETERARRLLDATEQRRREEQGTFTDLANVLQLIIASDNDAALALLDEHIQRRDLIGSVDGEVAYKHAQLYALAGAEARAHERLAVAVEQGFVCLACAERDFALAPLAQQAEFAALRLAISDQSAAFRQSVAATRL